MMLTSVGSTISVKQTTKRAYLQGVKKVPDLKTKLYSTNDRRLNQQKVYCGDRTKLHEHKKIWFIQNDRHLYQ